LATVEDKGLKSGALSLVSNVVIGVASAGPGYSLASVIGVIVAAVGLQTPAILLVSFVPMLLIAASYYYMNRADPDCGTTFTWVTKAIGPYVGWMSGWAILLAGMLVIGLLGNTAALYGILLFDPHSTLAATSWEVNLLAVAIIAVMTWVVIVGIEMSARTQVVLIALQLGALALFAIVALVKVATGDGGPGSANPALSWFDPFAIPTFNALTAGLLTGIFIYWGWDSAVTVNEESSDSSSSPGKAALLATLILLGIYLLVGTGILSYAGVDELSGFKDSKAFNVVANQVLGSPWDRIVILAVLTSALASAQTTILPGSRTSLSMARTGAFPAAFGRVHPRFQTPHIGSIITAAVSTAWYIGFTLVSTSFLDDSLKAIGFMIAFYYAATGYACPVYYRRYVFKSAKHFLLVLVGPVVGALILTYVFVKSAIDYIDPAELAKTGAGTVFGLGVPLVVAIGLMLLGAALMVAWRLTCHAAFFQRGREAAEAAP
jgi:amino acid transporter